MPGLEARDRYIGRVLELCPAWLETLDVCVRVRGFLVTLTALSFRPVAAAATTAACGKTARRRGAPTTKSRTRAVVEATPEGTGPS